jgi:outer membrane autotransporter protein
LDGGKTYLGSSHEAKGYDLDVFNITVGAQMNFISCMQTGVAFAYEYDSIDFNLNGSGKAQTYQGALYGTYNKDCYYVFSDFVMGETCFKVHRDIRFGAIDRHAHGSPSIFHTDWYVELGINYDLCYLTMQPFAGIDLGYYNRDSFKECGANAAELRGNSKTISTLDSYLGFHLDSDIQCVKFSGDLAWIHHYNKIGDYFHGHFKDFGHDFSIKGVNPGRDGLEGSVQVATTFCDCYSVFAEFSGEKWEEFSNYEFGLGLVARW